MNSKKTIVITGAAGFIGSHATDLFLEKGYNVVGIDSMTYASNEENLTSAKKTGRFKLCKHDIRDTLRIENICQENDIEWIFNFAAETHVDNSIINIKPFIESNIEGVASLLSICKNNQYKLFHISTDEVYGSLEDGSFTEKDVLSPQNPYSATKASSEHLIKSYANTYGVDYTIVRPANNFGPRQNKEKFLPTILNSVFSNQKIPVYGDGMNIRDWLYVKDNASIIYEIWRLDTKNETFNISCSNEMTNIDLIKEVSSYLEKDWKSLVNFVKDRKGHDKRYSINTVKLNRLLSLSKTPFSDALSDTIRFYRNII